MKLKLSRPLVFFDLETTGVNPLQDKIIEISLIKLTPQGDKLTWTMRINPGIKVPEATIAVHHITDADLADKPSFAEVAGRLHDWLEGCDMAGYNSNKFDVPMLQEEFKRVGIKFDTVNRHFVDVQNIFYAKEPRTLTAAYRFYCGKELDNAHSATGDTEATLEVLLNQMEKYSDLPADVEGLSRVGQKKTLDLAGRLAFDANGEPVFNFGKHKGKKVVDVFKSDKGYYTWMMQGEFPQNTKDVLSRLYYKFTHPDK